MLAYDIRVPSLTTISSIFKVTLLPDALKVAANSARPIVAERKEHGFLPCMPSGGGSPNDGEFAVLEEGKHYGRLCDDCEEPEFRRAEVVPRIAHRALVRRSHERLELWRSVQGHCAHVVERLLPRAQQSIFEGGRLQLVRLRAV